MCHLLKRKIAHWKRAEKKFGKWKWRIGFLVYLPYMLIIWKPLKAVSAALIWLGGEIERLGYWLSDRVGG